MRRAIPIILLVLVLAAPFVLKQLYGTETAPPAGARELVILTAHVEGIRREFDEAFSRWHEQHFGQPVRIVYLNYGGAADIVRFFQNAQPTTFKSLGTYQIDLVWGGGDFLFERQLKPLDCLEPIQLPAETMRFAFPHPTLNNIALYDTKAGTWFGTALSSFGICYNKDVCQYLGVAEPKTWSDLADAKWRRWIVLADPTRSASARTAFMVIVERAMLDADQRHESEDRGWANGMGLVRLIASNARAFNDSASALPGMIATGDAGAAMAIDFYGRSEIQAVGAARMGYVEPIGATAINPDPIALIRGAEHRELAMRFIQFVLSEPGQKLWNTRAGAPGGPRLTSLRRLPIAPSVYSDLTDFTDPVDPFTGNLAFDTSNARRQTFVILGELIQMSCIDLLDELRETRQAIDRAARTDLLARLGTFPFDQAEAMHRIAQWNTSDIAGKLNLKRKWTAEFRDEYRQLREEAGGR